MKSEWKEFRLGDITDWASGGTPSKQNADFWNGTIPWISASSMGGNRYNESDLKITQDGLKAGSRLAGKDSILLLVRGSALHQRIPVGIATTEVSFNQDVKAIKVKEEFIDPWYLLFWFMCKEKDLLNMVENTGIGAGKLDTKRLQDMLIKIPPAAERNRIRGFAKALDDKLCISRQTNQILETMAQTIFKSWFVDFEPVKAKITAIEAGEDTECVIRAAMRAISGKTDDELDQLQAGQPENYANLKTTAELFPAAMKDSELGKVPEGWSVKAIQDLAKIIKGKSYSSAELVESKTALVTLKSFNRGGGYRLDGLKEYTGSYKAEQEVFAGDLVIAYTDVTQNADVIGKPAMVVSDSRYEHLVISLDVALVRPKIDYHKYFLYGLAMTDTFQNHTRSYTTGTTVLHLGKSAVPEFHFLKPSEELLKLYEQNVSPMFKLVNENIEDNRNMENLRDTLLPKLLSGELEVNAINKAES